MTAPILILGDVTYVRILSLGSAEASPHQYPLTYWFAMQQGFAEPYTWKVANLPPCLTLREDRLTQGLNLRFTLSGPDSHSGHNPPCPNLVGFG